jgi:hypothetical protein
VSRSGRAIEGLASALVAEPRRAKEERYPRGARRSGLRTVALPNRRAFASAVLIGLTAGILAACGGTASRPSLSFATCPLLPRDPQNGLFAVPGGWLVAMSVTGTTCQLGEQLMASDVRDLDAGKSADQHPLQVAGWNCFNYDGNQTTCLRGRATLYAQYLLS